MPSKYTPMDAMFMASVISLIIFTGYTLAHSGVFSCLDFGGGICAIFGGKAAHAYGSQGRDEQ